MCLHASVDSNAAMVVYNISESSLSGCRNIGTLGISFWTAGQRIDPSRETTFVWRMTSTDSYSDTVSAMSYSNWDAGQPDYYKGNEACMDIWSAQSYAWHDDNCSYAMCSVCEIDI